MHTNHKNTLKIPQIQDFEANFNLKKAFLFHFSQKTFLKFLKNFKNFPKKIKFFYKIFKNLKKIFPFLFKF